MAGDDELFKTAPPEVLRYFREKQSIPTFDWRDIAPEEHAYSWTVAKSTGFDILDDIRAAVDDAITHRLPFEEFQKRLQPVLEAKGWWGKRIVDDPVEGIHKVAQLGSPRRLRTIYWANTRTAHAAGEWERTQRTKRFLPFLLYTLSHAERRRPEHVGWVGVILPVDDPWWDTHYPPNGWGCKCGVRQITRREASGLGWQDGMTGPQIVMRPWKNKRSGRTVMVPMGIDPGWANNPGKHRARNVSEFLSGQITAMPEHRQRIAIADILGSPILDAYVRGDVGDTAFLPVGTVAADIVTRKRALSNVVRLSPDSVKHILHEHANRKLTATDFRHALSVIASPVGVIVRGKGIAYYGASGGTWWRVAVKLAAGGQEWWLSSFHRKSEDAARAALASARRKGELSE